MGKNDIVAGIRLEGEKQFKDAIASVNKSLASAKSEMALVKAECAGQENSLESLSKKHEVLNKILQEQKRKVEATKDGLDHAKQSYDNVGKGLEQLWVDLEKATDKLQNLENTYGTASKEAEEQRKEIQRLNAVIEKGEINWKRAGDKVKDWESKLNTAEAQVIQANKAVNKNASYMAEAEEATDKCATSIDKFGKEIAKVDASTETFADGFLANLAASGVEKGVELLVSGAEALGDMAMDASSAAANLAASTGASEIAAKRYQDIMMQVKGNNFGEDYNDVADAISTVVQTMGELNDVELQNVTENAISLRDTFGYDYQESIRAADMLMDQFGITSQQAFNLIVQGSQEGLNKNGDLLDVINEYSVHYAQMGLSADEFFNSLANGTEAGTFSVDKLGDAYKEFGIRVKDTSDTTTEGYNLLGLNADTMREKFAEGGESAKEAGKTVVDALIGMDDKVAQNQAGVALFGTMWEDLGMTGIAALTDLEGNISSTKDAMDKLNQTKMSDLGTAIGGLGSAIQEKFVTPILEHAIPAATDLINGITKKLKEPKTALQSFLDEIEASNEATQAAIESAQNTISGAQGDVAKLEAYKTTLLELNEAESLTEFQKYQLASAVNELSGQMPGLAAAFDSTTGSLNLTNEELVTMFDNAEALAMQEALIKAQAESYEALAEATLNVVKADSAVKTATDALTEANKKNAESQDYLSGGYGDFYSEALEAQIVLDEATKAQEEAAETAKAVQKQIDEENKAFAELKEQYGMIPEAASEANEAVENTGKVVEETARVFDEYGNDITDLSEEQAAAVTEASKEIVEAYENMRDGIASSIEGSISLFDEFSGGAEVSAKEMISNLDSQIDGITNWKDNMKTLAGELGDGMSQELYDKLAEMGPESANAVQTLVDALNSETGEFEEISRKWTEALQLKEDAAGIADFTTAGQDAANQYATGMLTGATATTEAAQQVAQAGAEAVQQEVPKFETAGTDSADNYTKALRSALSQSSEAGRQLASVARNALVSHQNSFYITGYNMAVGVASGIRGGQSGAISAAANMARQALQAAKNELEIRSPSRKFRKQVGQNISESTAFGINDKASLAGKAAAKMSNKVYTNAVSWLSKYKKKQKVSVSDEEWYWKQVLKHTKQGTSAYNKVIKTIANISLTESGLNSKTATSVSKKISSNFGVSKTTGSGKNKKTKDAETYYSEVYSAAEKYLSNQQVLNDWSLQQELAYWNAVKSQLKKGSQAWYDATKQINNLEADIAEGEAQAAEKKVKTHANVQKDILDKYKVYYKVSAKAEMEYWNIARQQFEAGTEERIEADQNYLEALQEFYDQRKELDEDYAESSQAINEQLADSVKELQDTYKDAVESRKQDILSSMNLFERWDASGYDSDTLLYNLKTQVAGLALWEQQLEELGRKGLSDALMEELSTMGPDAAANIFSLNQMTAEQLDEYNKLWEQKNALAYSQALKDNEDLLKETNAEITNLRTETQSELNALNADYRAALQELNTGISSDLKNLVDKAGSIGEDAVSNLIAGIGKAATSVDAYTSTTKVVDNISSQFSILKQEGQTIGKETLDSMLAELTDGAKITAAAQSAVQSIKQAMQQELSSQQSAMMELNSIGNGGIAMLNNMTREYGTTQTIVNVDNSSVLVAMNQVSKGLQTLIELIANSQMVMDTGAVVAELQPLLSQENATALIRTNRGRI